MKAIALFVLVAFSIYTGCATTNTYRVNVSDKDASDLVGKQVHVHHDMKKFPTPIEGTVGKSTTKSVLVVYTATQGKLEIPSKQINRIEVEEQEVDRSGTWKAVGIGAVVVVVVGAAVLIWAFKSYYDSWGI